MKIISLIFSLFVGIGSMVGQDPIKSALQDISQMLESNVMALPLSHEYMRYSVYAPQSNGRLYLVKLVPKSACKPFPAECDMGEASTYRALELNWAEGIFESWSPYKTNEDVVSYDTNADGNTIEASTPPSNASITWKMNFGEWQAFVYISFSYDDTDLNITNSEAREIIEPIAKALNKGMQSQGLLNVPDMVEIPVVAKLRMQQVITPPSNGGLLSKMEVKQILIIEFKDLPPTAYPAIRAQFDIEKPSRLIYPARYNKIQNGIIRTPFIFNKPAPEKLTKATATLPNYVTLNAKGEYEQSEEKQTISCTIRSGCKEIKTSAFNRAIINEMSIDETEIQNEFAAAMEEYGMDRLSFSNYNSVGLGYYMANHGGVIHNVEIFGIETGQDLELRYYSNKEVALNRYILATGDPKEPLSLKSVFKEALHLNEGDVTNALLTMHNVLRAATRGGEDFSNELNSDEKEVLSKVAKKRTKEEIFHQRELRELTGRESDSEILKSIKSIRPEKQNSDSGALYHLIAMTLASTNARINKSPYYPITGLDDGDMLPKNVIGKMDLKWLAWFEEYAISKDIYTDPTEYCIDHVGIRMGDFIVDKAGKAKWKENVERLRNAFTMKSFNEGWQAVRVNCPVKTTIKELRTEQEFVFDALNGTIAGNLNLYVYVQPTGKDWEMACLLPKGEYRIDFEGRKDASFSVGIIDFEQKQGQIFEDAKIKNGEQYHLDLKILPKNRTLSSALSGDVSPKFYEFNSKDWNNLESYSAAPSKPSTPENIKMNVGRRPLHNIDSTTPEVDNVQSNWSFNTFQWIILGLMLLFSIICFYKGNWKLAFLFLIATGGYALYSYMSNKSNRDVSSPKGYHELIPAEMLGVWKETNGYLNSNKQATIFDFSTDKKSLIVNSRNGDINITADAVGDDEYWGTMDNNGLISNIRFRTTNQADKMLLIIQYTNDRQVEIELVR